MTKWNASPPKGGPMVAVPGFPRPLYPPDAAPGKTPSVDGPDVEAYKRTLGRLGAWDWNPTGYDRAYSNAFSHGKSAQYGGIGAVQLWAKIQATGWIGEQTFNFLRSVRIGEGMPNAGQMAMDANAANLIAQAWKQFQGVPDPTTPNPPPSGGGNAGTTTRARALQGAIKWIGTKESPANSNSTPFGQWYGVDEQPWCAIFCTYCFEVEAGGSPSFVRGSRWAYVPYIVSDARAGKNGLSVTATPMAGDLVCYDWGRDGTYDHVGIFEGWANSKDAFTAIEGNTSTSNNSNGGQVMRRTRYTSGQATTFVRVA